MNREPGYYWVYYSGWTTHRWEVWEWDGEEWWQTGSDQNQPEPTIVSEKIIPPKPILPLS